MSLVPDTEETGAFVTLPSDWTGRAPTDHNKKQLLDDLQTGLEQEIDDPAERTRIMQLANEELSKAFTQARANDVKYIATIIKSIDKSLLLLANLMISTTTHPGDISAISLYGEMLGSTEFSSIDIIELKHVGSTVRAISGDLDIPEPSPSFVKDPLIVMYHVPVPNTSKIVTLTFITPNGVLRRPFAELFDTIANSLRVKL